MGSALTFLFGCCLSAVAILLAVAAFVLVRRHRMRQQQQHVLQLSRLESTSIGGTESPDWKRQKQHVSGGIDIDSADVNVSGKRASGPGSQGIEVTAATAGPAMRGPPPPFASAIGRDSSGILAATSQNQPAAPDGVAGVAALWAGAAQAARSQPSLALDSDPMLAWIHSQMPAEQQQQQQQQGLLPTPFQSHGSSSGGATVVPRTVTPAPSARAIDISRRASSVALMDLAQWEVPYSHLKLIRPLGEGSYGKVGLEGTCDLGLGRAGWAAWVWGTWQVVCRKLRRTSLLLLCSAPLQTTPVSCLCRSSLPR